MKKLLLAGNVIFACLFYFQNCVMPKQVFLPMQEGGSKNWHCLTYADSVFNGIPYDVAYKMFDQYRLNQYNHITTLNPLNTNDSKSVWFSLDILKKFIYKIEDTLNNKGFDQATRLGIRFYFAAYPDADTMALDPNLNLLPPEYEYHHTLFLVPTYDTMYGTKLIHQDFNAFGTLNSNKHPVAPHVISGKNYKTFNTPTSTFGITNDIYMQNHGEIGPPPVVVPGAIFQ